MAWDLFVKPLWGWLTLAILLLIALVLSFVTNSASSAVVSAFQPRGPQLNLSGVVIGAIPQWIGLIIIVSVWGKLQPGSFCAPFTRERNFFESSDIAALTIQVDKAVRRAVDAAGLDASLLRAKEQFKAGRRGAPRRAANDGHRSDRP